MYTILKRMGDAKIIPIASQFFLWKEFVNFSDSFQCRNILMQKITNYTIAEISQTKQMKC